MRVVAPATARICVIEGCSATTAHVEDDAAAFRRRGLVGLPLKWGRESPINPLFVGFLGASRGSKIATRGSYNLGDRLSNTLIRIDRNHRT